MFEERLFSGKQDFSAPSGNMLLWEDFPFQRNLAVGMAQAMGMAKRPLNVEIRLAKFLPHKHKSFSIHHDVIAKALVNKR